MLNFKTTAAQGEITVRRVEKVPSKCTPMKPEGNVFIVGHSETGHHHVLDAPGADVMVSDRPLPGMRVLYAILENPTALRHLRDHDTHAPIQLEPGVYEFRIAREFDHYGELARQSMD